jgi:hypothetical protein
MSLPPLIARRVVAEPDTPDQGWVASATHTATGVISLSALFDGLQMRRAFQRGNSLFQFLKAR